MSPHPYPHPQARVKILMGLESLGDCLYCLLILKVEVIKKKTIELKDVHFLGLGEFLEKRSVKAFL